MTDQVILDGVVHPIREVELHIPLEAGARVLYMGVVAEGAVGAFGLWGVELTMLQNIEDLSGQRIHLQPNGESFDDDTLGADILGAYASSDLNYWSTSSTSFVYGEIMVDFTQVNGRVFHVHLELSLADSSDNPADLPAEAFAHRGSADFTVAIDEENPLEIED